MAWSRFSNSNTSALCLMNIKSKNSHENGHTNNSALLPLEQGTNKLFFLISVILTVKLKSPKVNKLPKVNKANKQIKQTSKQKNQ
jgi:hypothetical protein